MPQVTRLLHKERLPDAALGAAAREVLAGRLGAGEVELGGGLWKKRLARPGGGKSGGYRAIVAYRRPRSDRVLFAFCFAKSAASTLTIPAQTATVTRPTRQAVEDEVLATAHALGAALHRVGALDAATIRDLDALCLPPRPEYGSAEVRRIRAAVGMSQPVFARLLGVDKSAVAQWERGAKRPSGPAAGGARPGKGREPRRSGPARHVAGGLTAPSYTG